MGPPPAARSPTSLLLPYMSGNARPILQVVASRQPWQSLSSAHTRQICFGHSRQFSTALQTRHVSAREHHHQRAGTRTEPIPAFAAEAAAADVAHPCAPCCSSRAIAQTAEPPMRERSAVMGAPRHEAMWGTACGSMAGPSQGRNEHDSRTCIPRRPHSPRLPLPPESQ